MLEEFTYMLSTFSDDCMDVLTEEDLKSITNDQRCTKCDKANTRLCSCLSYYIEKHIGWNDRTKTYMELAELKDDPEAQFEYLKKILPKIYK